MTQPPLPPKRTWLQKFQHALRGIAVGVRGQSSFAVHCLAAALVILAGIILRVSRTEWYILALCIVAVMAAELFNSALESLAQAIDRQPNPWVRDGLDIASGAVLVSAIGAAIVGAVIFTLRLGVLLGWWG